MATSAAALAKSSASAWASKTLDTSVNTSREMQAALSSLSCFIIHRSQWECLGRSYHAVTTALVSLFQLACFILGPAEQERERMCHKLTAPLLALCRAVQGGQIACNQESFSLSGSSSSKHKWLLRKALKVGKSTDVVDLHLHHLLWTSSVVREQILRSAPFEGSMVESLLVGQTRELYNIWSCVDEHDDFLSARDLLEKIKREAQGDTWHLASFFHQKLSWAENSGRIRDGDDLPAFLWVNSEELTRNSDMLGRGGFGAVHEAVWLRGRFAEKSFLYNNSVMFGREAAIQAQLCHPNVIPLMCCTRDHAKGKCSLVMQLMQHDLGVFMSQRMEAGSETPFNILLAVDLMLQIARGMEYLHSDDMRVMHRDLKSSNILVKLSGKADVSKDTVGIDHGVHLKVADFGVAKAKLATSRYTTKPIGTLAWRAPELFKNGEEDGDAKYTNKADVYSFGMVCYEILTGKLPYEGGPNIKSRVLSGERPSLPKHCPVALSSYIQQCWHAIPDQRPTFTQICRILRFLKVCILLHKHDHGRNASEYNKFWLQYPFSSDACMSIEKMLLSFERRLDGPIQPRLLVIPFEMYCCRVVLQNYNHWPSSHCSCGTFTKWLWELCVKRTQVNSVETTCTSDPGARPLLEDSSSTYTVKAGDICLDEVQANGITVAEVEVWNPEVQSCDPQVPAPILTGNSIRYAVKEGDTGWTIAEAHSISYDDLQSWNPNVVWTNLHIGQSLYVSPPGTVSTAPPPPPGKYNGDVFMEYIGAVYKGVRFSDVPINRNVSFHYILAYAIDYTTEGGITPSDGMFNIYWQHSVLTPDAIKAIKAQYSKVKVMLSIGGDTVSDQSVQFRPKTVESWVANAVNSLTRLIKQFHLDGIDIGYEHIENSVSPKMFATCIGQLLTRLKERHVIAMASIAPFDNVESHYLNLWEDHGDLIDYVNFQFYSYSTEITAEEYVNLYEAVAAKYGGGSKVLTSFNTDPNTGPPPDTALAASRLLQSNGRLPGICIWSADGSRSLAFKYEIKAQALLSGEEEEEALYSVG